MSRKHRRQQLSLLVVAAVMVAIASIAALMGMGRIALFVMLLAGITLLPVILKRYVRLHVPISIVILLLFFTAIAIGFGEYANFYERFYWFDSVLHFGSAVLVGFFAVVPLVIVARKRHIKEPTILIVLFAFFAAVTVGVLWEIIEFYIDALFGSNMQPSLADTMHDLQLEVAGSLIGAIGGLYVLRRARHPHRSQQSIPLGEDTLEEAVEENANWG
jgi:hypothetical protein